jgi:hypothetical protein
MVGVTVGLAGFLLFLVQPMMGKYILPWFGGSVSTWTVCLLFFQGALLAGYFYAFVIAGRLSLRMQALLQLVILVAAALTLPIEPSDAWKPLDADAPAQRILGTLAASVGLPYAVLATTSPLLQRWVSLIDVDRRVLRYFAVSNFGSFLGLLSYPFVFEPLSSSSQQTIGWSWAFGMFAVCFGASAVLAILATRGIRAAALSADVAAVAPTHVPMRLLSAEAAVWIGWGAGGTVLLLATTNLISEWISVVPFLWVVPLALYLLTFVLVFAQRGYYRREIYLPLFLALAIATLFIGKPLSAELLLTQIVLLSACMFAGCMICHGELVAAAPPADRLTGFYLAIAFGGFLGGFLVTFAAPVLLPDFWEFHIAILVIVGCAVYVEWCQQGALARRIPRLVFYPMAAVFVAVIAGYVVLEIRRSAYTVWQLRNFYGVVKVVDDRPSVEPIDRRRTMWQSGEDQGGQYLDPSRRYEPACDFGEDSAVGLALRYNAVRRKGGFDAPIRAGHIGMGAAMTLALARPGDLFRFYELNPAVAKAAHEKFTFIRDTKAAAVDIILGDGRLSLERESKIKNFPKFDVITLDAYRGAAPPIHLITKEAYEIYFSMLKPDGILAVDLDLDTFELAPLHRGISALMNVPAGWFNTLKMARDCADGVSWAVYTRDQGFWDIKRVARNRSPWPDGLDTKVVWTDRSSNLFRVLKFSR